MHILHKNLEDFTFNLLVNCLHANKFYVKMSGVERKNGMCVQRCHWMKSASFMMIMNVYSVLYRICSNEIGKKFGKEVTQYD